MRTLNTITIMLMLAACTGRGDIRMSEDTTAEEKIVSNQVETDTLQAAQTDIVGQGTVKALRKADIAFELALPIKQVLVKNGDKVKKGQTLATLDTYKMQNDIEQSAKSLESSRLEMQDVIISQGYDPQRMSEVPEKVKKLAEVKSGYSLKQTQLAAARHELAKATVTAPFGGVVANLEAHPYSIAQPGQAICRIIDTSEMKVKFKVMEQELARVKKGTQIVAVPFSDQTATYRGIVTEINPIVDEQGSVSVKALLNGGAGLFDGMHVKVKIEN